MLRIEIPASIFKDILTFITDHPCFTIYVVISYSESTILTLLFSLLSSCSKSSIFASLLRCDPHVHNQSCLIHYIGCDPYVQNRPSLIHYIGCQPIASSNLASLAVIYFPNTDNRLSNQVQNLIRAKFCLITPKKTFDLDWNGSKTTQWESLLQTLICLPYYVEKL